MNNYQDIKPLRAGVLGVGHLGAIHAKLWKQTGGAELAGVFDTDPERAKAIAREQKVSKFASIDELLAAIDVLSIVTPTSTHAELAARAMNAGVHCFVEKPIAASYQEAQVLVRLAEKLDMTLQVGHVERFNAALLAIENDALAPRFIESHRLAQFSARALDVSVIHDLMIHDIDLALWLVRSEVVEIRASGVAVLSDELDIANARLEFANGCVANLTASRISQSPMRKMRLFGRDSYVSLNFAAPSAELFTIGDDAGDPGAPDGGMLLGAIQHGTNRRTIRYRKPELPQVNAIARELEEFVRSVRNHTPPPVTAAAAAEALRIAEEVVASIRK